MNNIIIGTAGHVDHGKTCLIRALTGIDTDRLVEEKKRGITIELGFAYLDLPDGRRAGIIDVPGHERFIRNMLAGAGGIDLAMLIVAADEGVMPQTAEHLGILSLLGIKQGVIVITKADMVESDWIDMVREDISGRVSGTFLENAPMLAVSAYTGQGIDELRAVLCEMIDSSGEKRLDVPMRIPIDRVFSVEGFGTVITGTLIEGTLREGDPLLLYPSGKETRARNIQVHGKDADAAYAGQRVAVNLAGLKKADIEKGDLIAPPGSLCTSMMADVRLRCLEGCGREIKNGSRLHFYHGSREVLCKVVLIDCDILTPGQSCYTQLRFEENVCLKPGDSFVTRFYSPLETVGGGIILDPAPLKHRQGDENIISELSVYENGSTVDKIELCIKTYSNMFYDIDFVIPRTGVLKSELELSLTELALAERIVKIEDGVYIHTDFARIMRKKAVELLDAFHKSEPLKGGLKREELRTRLLPQCELGHADGVINYLISQKAIKDFRGLISLQSFKVELSEALSKLTAQIERLYLDSGYTVPSTDDVTKQLPNPKQTAQVLSAMLTEGTLMRLDAQIYMHRQHYDKALEVCRSTIAQSGQMTLAEYRDLLGTSRKYCLALLEHFDNLKITRKVGDARVLI